MKKRKKIPKFKSEKEDAAFWNKHSPLDYPDEFKEIKKPFQFDVDFLKKMAREHKEAIICEETGKVPPKTHDLIYLTGLGKVKLNPDLLDFIGMINNAGLVTRYPEDLSKLVSSYPRDIAKVYSEKTQEVIKCLKQNPALKE